VKIGLIGWYGHENYGDERIRYCIQRFFSQEHFHVVNGFKHLHQNIDELNRCDYILIGGGGIITRTIGRYTRLIRQFKKPYSLIGIGVEANHVSMSPFFEEIKSSAEFIYVRDQESSQILKNHPKVIVGPDISFLYPFDIQEPVKADVCGLNLRDWFYWQAEFDGTFHKLMKDFNKRFPLLKTFYPLAQWNPDQLISKLSHQFEETVPIPLYFESAEHIKNDTLILSRYFQNIPKEFTIDLFKKIRYLIAMRFHALIFATQCGIPFISLSYQPKNERLCAAIGIKDLSINLYTPNNIDEKISFLRTHESQIRERLLTYRAKSVQEAQKIFHQIKLKTHKSI